MSGIREAVTPPDTASHADINVGEAERWVSAIGGGLMFCYGLSRGNLLGYGLAALGGSLVYRGLSGHCSMYAASGINTAQPTGEFASVRAGSGVKVEESVSVNRPVEEVYRFWRNFENLPRFMNHLESVRNLGGSKSHWVAKAPLGRKVEWDAEIINEQINSLIAWRSLPGADVDNAGSVHFTASPGGRSTEVRVTLKYDPPAGKVGAYVARLFGEEPRQQIAEDLRRFKQLLEGSGPAGTASQRLGAMSPA